MSHPTRWEAMRTYAAQHEEQIVAIGAGAPGCVVSIPMPAGRPSIAGSTLRRWCRACMAPSDILVAWDEWAVCAAGETSQPLVAVLDGLHGDRAIVNRASRVLCDGNHSLVAGSDDVAAAIDVSLSCSLPIVPPTSLQTSEDQSFEAMTIVVLAEPMSGGLCSPVVPLLGRLNLLETPLRVRIAESVIDIESTVEMLQVIGVEDVIACRDDEAHRWARAGVAVLPACAAPTAWAISPTGPALAAWARGATLLLTSGHPADHMLTGCEGVLRQVERQPDVAARALLSPLSTALIHRACAARWFDELSYAIASAVEQATVSLSQTAEQK
ncbi:MAG: hypothetical protein P8I91_01595 [Phycisphaerales bacterium]|nr:hypothetical protein [Phycisphaerales bacterium]